MNALRPYRTVGPGPNSRSFPDQTCIVPFHHLSDSITGRALISHLGDYFIFLCSFCQNPGFIDIVRHGFLDIDVFSHFHRHHRLNGMHMVWSGYRHCIDIFFFFFEHDSIVLIVGGFAMILSRAGSPCIIYIT